MLKSKSFKEGVALLCGTIIGSGYLILPFSFLKAGILPNIFWLIFFTCCLIIVNLIYAEINLVTHNNHRLPGYADLYLGKIFKLLSRAIFILGILGGLIVYLILGSRFLILLASPIFNLSTNNATLIFWILSSVVVFLNFKFSSKVNLYLTIFTVFIFFIVSIFCLINADFNNFKIIPTESFFFPYGLILYSLIGWLVIPEIIVLIQNNKEDQKIIKPIILIGTIIPTVVYFVFGLSVFLLLGANTSRDAFTSLINFLPQPLFILAALMAFLEILNSYFSFGISAISTLKNDFGFKKQTAQILFLILPIAIFFIGFIDFVKIIAVLGASFESLNILTILLVYNKLKKTTKNQEEKLISISKPLLIVLVVIFVVGGIIGTINVL